MRQRKLGQPSGIDLPHFSLTPLTITRRKQQRRKADIRVDNDSICTHITQIYVDMNDSYDPFGASQSTSSPPPPSNELSTPSPSNELSTPSPSNGLSPPTNDTSHPLNDASQHLEHSVSVNTNTS